MYQLFPLKLYIVWYGFMVYGYIVLITYTTNFKMNNYPIIEATDYQRSYDPIIIQ